MKYGVWQGFVNFMAVVMVLGAPALFAVSAYAEQPIKLLALGDSLTAGYGLPAPDAFPVRLQSALQTAGQNVVVINGGVSGDTSTGGRARVEWLLGSDVDAVILELGANDGLRGIDPALTKRNLDWILSRLVKKGLPVLLTGMRAPPNLGPDYGREFDGMYPALAAKYGADNKVLLYPFFLHGVAADPTLNQADGIHPNTPGVAIIVQQMLPSVMKLLTLVDDK